MQECCKEECQKLSLISGLVFFRASTLLVVDVLRYVGIMQFVCLCVAVCPMWSAVPVQLGPHCRPHF